MYKIAVIAGDGIGPEVMNETLKIGRILREKYGTQVEFEEFPYGADYYLSTGITIPEEVFTLWPRKYNGILLGAVGDPRVKNQIHAKEILMGFRLKLDLFVNFRPVNLLNIDYCPLKNVKNCNEVNFNVFRENTEDIYVNMGGSFKNKTDDETSIECAVHTYKGINRIIHAAFEYAQIHKCSSVVMSDKSNVMKYAGNLWQRVFYEVGSKYPTIEKRHMYIDALCMDILRNTPKYEVIVTSNMFGDILTDVAAQIQGGMGLAASVNYNPDHNGFVGLFEPVHGSAPDIAGQNKANPIACILSFHLLLKRLEMQKEADLLLDAIKQTVNSNIVTPDLGGKCSTSEVGDFIINILREK